MTYLQPLVLSGGAGTRLWPASRARYPKQLLPLVGETTMLQATLERLANTAWSDNPPIVCCNDAHRFLVAQQLQEIACAADVIVEPAARNTAPAVAIAALHALQKDEHSLLLVMPADHNIADPLKFRESLTTGLDAAMDGNLVTFGVTPHEPKTGYGYIEVASSDSDYAPVKSFVEKPDLTTATQYVDGGRHFWNAGIFMFSARNYLDELGRYMPAILAACEKSMAGQEFAAGFIYPQREAFLACPSMSIDYAVMEKTERAAMVPLDAGWTDVGSWSALHDIADKDRDENFTTGDAVLLNCKNSYVSSKSRLVAAVGVEDLVVLETKDSVVVIPKSRSEDIRKLVDLLKENGRPEVELAREVFRPWGSFDSLESDDGFQVKRLVVNPGAILSLQAHERRAEHWIVVRGTARVTLNDDEFDLGVNEATFVPIGAKHRIANPGTEPVHIIEVQCGDYLGEDDIVRFADDYGRAGTNT